MEAWWKIIDAFFTHPFWVIMGGYFAYFLLGYSYLRNKGKIKTWKQFIKLEKDEMIVTGMFSLMFLIWDDEMINAVHFVGTYIKSDISWHEIINEYEPKDYELPLFLYLFIGPVVERLYALYVLIKGMKKPTIK